MPNSEYTDIYDPINPKAYGDVYKVKGVERYMPAIYCEGLQFNIIIEGEYKGLRKVEEQRSSVEI